MTYPISDVTRRVVYSGSAGVGPYSFSFEILLQGDVAVYLNSTLLTITTDYSVTINANGTGSVTLVVAATSSDTVTILGNKGIQRQTDFVTGGDLFATSLNDELDAQTIFAQQNAEAIGRAIKIPPESSLSIDTTLPVPQANYVLGWNQAGDAILNLQELGTYQGTDATTTTAAYNQRDLVKSTTAGQLNNVYICIQDSPAGTALTNTSYWALIIDAVAAGTSAAAAAASASAASASETAAAASESAAATSESNAASSASSASTSASNAASSASTASTAATNAGNSATAAAASETAAAASESAAATSETNAASSASAASTSATNAASSASAASTSETNAASSASAASTSASNAASSATAASGSATSAAASATAAQAAVDSIEAYYLGSAASDPTVDDNGDPLTAGDWYFNTTTNKTRIYNGSSWQDAVVDTSGVVTKTSNTGSAVLPAGTTAQRDGSPSAGYLRWNSDDTSAEVYDGSAWTAVGGGNTTDEGLYEMANTISANYTITSGNNAMSAGPITVASGVSVSVPTGSRWVIV